MRDHEYIARIEVGKEQIDLLLDLDKRQTVVSILKGVGYQYVSLDLEGYLTVAMNEVLGDERQI